MYHFLEFLENFERPQQVFARNKTLTTAYLFSVLKPRFLKKLYENMPGRNKFSKEKFKIELIKALTASGEPELAKQVYDVPEDFIYALKQFAKEKGWLTPPPKKESLKRSPKTLEDRLNRIKIWESGGRAYIEYVLLTMASIVGDRSRWADVYTKYHNNGYSDDVLAKAVEATNRDWIAPSLCGGNVKECGLNVDEFKKLLKVVENRNLVQGVANVGNPNTPEANRPSRRLLQIDDSVIKDML